MKFPILRAGLIAGALGLSATGCHHTPSSGGSVSQMKPEDPSAWSDKDVLAGSSSPSSSLPRSSSRLGGLSSDAQAVERSFGIGQ